MEMKLNFCLKDAGFDFVEYREKIIYFVFITPIKVAQKTPLQHFSFFKCCTIQIYLVQLCEKTEKDLVGHGVLFHNFTYIRPNHKTL